MQETNLGLKKPALNEFYDLLLQNANLDLLDQLIADRIQKSMIVNNALSTNPNTVVAGPVAKDLQEQINSLNDNLAQLSGVKTRTISDDTVPVGNPYEVLKNKWTTLPVSPFLLVQIYSGTATSAIVQKSSDTYGSVIMFSYNHATPVYYRCQGGAWDVSPTLL